jgi:hypothetical protein
MRPCTLVSSPRDHHVSEGQLDHRDLTDPQEFAGKGLQMVDPGELAKVRQHVEDPVIPHDTLVRKG